MPCLFDPAALADAMHGSDVHDPDQTVAYFTSMASGHDGLANGIHHYFFRQHTDHELVGEIRELILDRALIYGRRGGKTLSLEDLKLDPRKVSEDLMALFKKEFDGVLIATQKVRPVP